DNDGLAWCLASVVEAIERAGPALKKLKETPIKKVTLTHYLSSTHPAYFVTLALLRQLSPPQVPGTIKVVRRFVLIDVGRRTFQPRSVLAVDPEIRKILEASLVQLDAGCRDGKR